MADAAPPRLGRYELLIPLGQGGMGEVFVARLRSEGDFQRFFAAKKIRGVHEGDENLLAMFFDEARIAACIHSPYVVPVLDVGRADDGSPYMIMELVHGVSVAQLARSGELPVEMVVAIAIDAARGLEDAHSALDPYGKPLHIVHRDVSPNNILVGVDGRARVTDFGVARASRRESRSAVGELKGTFAYFSPEQTTGEADRQSDVFSLGVVTWELLTRQRLFAEPTPAAVLTAVASKAIPSASDVSPRVPTSIAQVVSRALARDRSRRHLRAADFADELERACVAEGIARSSAREIGDRVREAAGPLLERLTEVTSVPRANRDDIGETSTVQERGKRAEPQGDATWVDDIPKTREHPVLTAPKQPVVAPSESAAWPAPDTAPDPSIAQRVGPPPAEMSTTKLVLLALVVFTAAVAAAFTVFSLAG